MSLEITASADGDNRLLSVTGEVDVSCADELRAAIDAQIAEGVAGELVIDLAGVPYIDSTGIGVLVGAAHRASEAGARSATSSASWVFSACRLTSTSAGPRAAQGNVRRTGD